MMCVDEAINLQRGYKILIIGGSALVVGIILTMVIFLTFKQTSFNINTGIDTISPHKSIIKTSEVNRGEKMGIGISSKPSDIPMNLQIIERPSLAKILDVNFTGSSFNSFIPNRDGEDTILITNLGSQVVSANTFLGNSNFFDASGQPKIFLGAGSFIRSIPFICWCRYSYSRRHNSIHRQKKSEKNARLSKKILFFSFCYPFLSLISYFILRSVKNNLLYVINYVALDEQYQKYLPVVINLIKSLDLDTSSEVQNNQNISEAPAVQSPLELANLTISIIIDTRDYARRVQIPIRDL